MDGDGLMDVIAIDEEPQALVEYEPDPYHGVDNWELSARGYRPALAFMTYGGSPLRKVQIEPPLFWREGASSDTTSGAVLLNAYDDDKGLRTITGGRAREVYYFDTSLVAGGDWDGDGFFDVAFGMHGGERVPPPLSSYWDTWDSASDPTLIMTYPNGTFHFAPFVDLRYGSPTGIPSTPAQRILSPTLVADPSLARFVSFPSRMEARHKGLFVTEARGSWDSPYYDSFAGPPGSAVPVP